MIHRDKVQSPKREDLDESENEAKEPMGDPRRYDERYHAEMHDQQPVAGLCIPGEQHITYEKHQLHKIMKP